MFDEIEATQVEHPHQGGTEVLIRIRLNDALSGERLEFHLERIDADELVDRLLGVFA